jgi:hypothetical protein
MFHARPARGREGRAADVFCINFGRLGFGVAELGHDLIRRGPALCHRHRDGLANAVLRARGFAVWGDEAGCVANFSVPAGWLICQRSQKAGEGRLV